MIKVLLDSGAYSAWRRGVRIDVKDYIAFIKRNAAHIEAYVSLDVIPGHGGRTADAAVIEKAAKQSYANHQRMKDAGLRPLPVFHQDDDFEWLESYLGDGETSIAFAAHGGHVHNDLPFFDQCFALLKGRGVKVHGLGQTTATVLRRYPFSSVDSGTWYQQGGHGRICFPIYVNGQADYRHRPSRAVVSARSDLDPNYVDRLSLFRRQQLESFLGEIGISLHEIRTSPEARWRVNIAYFNGLAKATDTVIYFVSRTGRQLRGALLRGNAGSHLLSYFDLMNNKRRDTLLEQYVSDGQPVLEAAQ